jgi:hypothetical protein
MIPSRPLTFAEIVGQTFSIYVRIFLRYALVFIALVVPGAALTTYAVIEASQHTIASAYRAGAFGDRDLTHARNEARNWIEQQNPILLASLRKPNDSTLANDTTYRAGWENRIAKNFEDHASEFSGDLMTLGAGFFLLLFGLFAAMCATTELTSQAFEERPFELALAIRTSLLLYAWKALFLYLIYFVATSAIDQLMEAIGGVSQKFGDGIRGFVSIAQIYVLVRLTPLFPALVSEELGPRRAVERAWDLSRKSGWRILGISGGFSILLFVALIVVTGISGVFFSGTYTWWTDFLTRDLLTVSWLVQSLPDFITSIAGELAIISLLFFGLLFVFSTVLYYDLRTRRDGPLAYLEEE